MLPVNYFHHVLVLQVIQLAFLVACMYTAVGLLRLGFMVRFLSHSVITGFTSGEARWHKTGEESHHSSVIELLRLSRHVASCSNHRCTWDGDKHPTTCCGAVWWCCVCAGAAIIIGMSQVRYIVGYKVPRQDSFHEQIRVLVEGRKGFMWQVGLAG